MTPVTSILNLPSSMKRLTSWLNVTTCPGSESPRNDMGQCLGITVTSYLPSGTESATLISMDLSSSLRDCGQIP